MYKILLVEDVEGIRRGIKSLIGQVTEHFTVVKEAENGKEALEYLSVDLPDAVITDIRMREMNGLVFIQKLKDKYPHMPVLIISGYGDFEYAQQAIRYGVSDYLLKPVDRKAFVTALERIYVRLSGRPSAPLRDESAAQDGTADKSADGKRWIRKIKEYVQANPEGDLSLQTLSELVHLNPAYLSRLFKQETKSNLSDYITEVRIERAKHLLLQTELKIYDIARLSGYQSPKHFMLVFKQQTGLSPTAYREQG
ncbi:MULTISPECIES: response regulator [unclassified Paenibacillus]|uniref:response regulator n=1 Tax=unclassified Paenibacillus TaxID=185978 RepID=UPI001C111005|nr:MULTISPECIES: response regulator [unclassified Paenibacillus]MBU5444770.1 response regulator [Paenibacillus sp. MSJ-34]CAH0119345.1 putative response regulatory protein [Paenibacillus sp. CECT 9249]